MLSRGALIVIEGVDRSGKSTQSKKLIDSLLVKNISAERMCFPDRTTWTGQLISKYLSDKECDINDQTVHLLFSANRWENVEKIQRKIAEGVTLIVDRYLYSGVAFSTAKGLNQDWCINPEIGLPKPDLVFLLNLENDCLKERTGFGEERYETLDMQEKVRTIFKRFAKNDQIWQVVDASKNFDEIQEELLQSVCKKVADIEKSQVPLQYFYKNHENGV